MTDVRELAEQAAVAARQLAPLGRREKDRALAQVAQHLLEAAAQLQQANAADLERAREAGLGEAMLDRLRFGARELEATVAGVKHIISLPDPVGQRGRMDRLDNGLLVGMQRIPLGVIAMVYESRPNVTVDAAALCLKSGNAVLLRGGKEAASTNQLLGDILRAAIASAGLPAQSVSVVPPVDREGIRQLIALDGLVDLVIPRGGEGLIRFVAEHARVPVIKHYQGVCHLYLDEGCDEKMALQLTLNAKLQRPGVCNALECLLIHEREAARLVPLVGRALTEAGVTLRGCLRVCELLPAAQPATEADWGREYLSKMLAVRVVADLDAALAHVARYGSKHTEAICTESHRRAQRWLREVDASCVLVNASTRFNDGGQLGLGAEIGISTSKLHAYGPMGLQSLTAQKWVVLGDGQVRT